ncbi:PAS domain-containing protein [Microcoleus sp. CAWBG58]|uniref:PAS domain-containing protein n=1 Tax=Microcoleus sp. CAWBG58 TaxID=2841651 RepID=UPI0025DED629|nr:PAS domain-containing protein [Microcoleus sp. CAWBG58]
MYQPFHAVSPAYPGPHSLPSLKSEFEALDKNPIEPDTILSKNIYIYDLVEQHNLSGSCSIANLLGYHTDNIAVAEPLDLAGLIHPDDLNRVSEHFQRFSTLHREEVISIEYRMRRADGQWCWLRSHETLLAQANDSFPQQIIGMIQVMDR